jgi:hypothetical protein
MSPKPALPGINPETEEIITLKQAGRMFPGRTGSGLDVSTVWRWVLNGRRGRKLESILIGGQRYTSRQAVLRFLAALNETTPCGETSAARQRAKKFVEQRLEADGL